MLARPAPMSNAERQRQFRKRNPGYYARLQARRRGACKRSLETQALMAKLAAMPASAEAETAQSDPLALPVLPGMNTIPTGTALSPLPMPQSQTPMSDRPIAA